MTTSSTTTASRPVAACTSSAGRRSESASTMPTTANQVMSVAANASAAPAATGRWYDCVDPFMLAVMAASTRMHSSPSRKTSTAMSSALTVEGLSSDSGSGVPPEAIAVQTSTASTMATPVQTAIRPPMRTARVPANAGAAGRGHAGGGVRKSRMDRSFRLILSAFTFGRHWPVKFSVSAASRTFEHCDRRR